MPAASPRPKPTPEDPQGSRSHSGRANPSAARRAAVPARRPRLHVVEDAELGPRPEASPRRTILFGLLGLSIAFLIFVQFYVARVESAHQIDAGMIGELTGMTVTTPSRAIYPRELRLSWEPVNGATSYLVRVRADDGRPVVDPMETMGTTWYPPNTVIPGLVPGGYVWTVEAIDGSGIALAKSQAESFSVRGIESRR